MNEHDEALAVAQDAINVARALIGVVDSRPAFSIALVIKARVLAALGETSSAYISRPYKPSDIYGTWHPNVPHSPPSSLTHPSFHRHKQHAAALFRETSIRDSEALADVLLVIATQLLLFEASRVQEAVANAEEYAPRFVRALMLAAACRPSSEAGVEYAKEAVEAHRPRRDLERAAHEQILTHLLMDVFSRLRELGREAEAIPFKTEAARLNPDAVESVDPPAAPAGPAGADYHKLLGDTMAGSEDEAEDI